MVSGCLETECLVKNSASLPPMSSVAVKTEYLVKHALRREIGNLGPTEAQAQQNLPRMLAAMRRPPLGSHHTIFSVGGDRSRVIGVSSYFRLMDRRETAARLEMRIVEVLLGAAHVGPSDPLRLRFVERRLGGHRPDQLVDQLVDVRLRTRGRALLLISVSIGAEVMLDPGLVEQAYERAELALEWRNRRVDVATVGASMEPRTGQHMRRMTRGLPLHYHTCVNVCGHRDFGTRVDRLVDRDVDKLALAGKFAEIQRGHDRDDRVFGCEMVRLPHPGRDRWRIVRAVGARVIAAYRHHAAHRELRQVAPLEVAVGAIEPVGGSQTH